MTWRLRIAVVLLTLAGCGVPVQDGPTVTPEAALPAERPEAPSNETTPDQRSIDVYLVQSDRLVRVERRVQTATLETSMNELASGPTRAEVERGLRSAIPPDVEVHARSRAAGLASVDVTSSILNVTGEEQILAIAQVVYTATAVADISSVQFVVDGEATDVPRGDGALSPTPVSRDDYASIAPTS